MRYCNHLPHKILRINMINLNKIINRLGKYLNKHIDGAYDYYTESNTSIVKFLVYYQIKQIPDQPGGEYDYSDLKEIDFEINITTYQDFIRINILEISPNETTIGYLKYDSGNIVFGDILSDIQKKIRRRFEGYEFLF